VSAPGSIVESQKQQQQQLARSPSNPYFAMPMKEPPKYDEAVRSKQSQVCDRILNIRIRMALVIGWSQYLCQAIWGVL
jgi:hypothetical protein